MNNCTVLSTDAGQKGVRYAKDKLQNVHLTIIPPNYPSDPISVEYSAVIVIYNKLPLLL